ncbi:putative lipid II flippase FtsW [Bacilliculturomica massiliensis]|uniref:putative lipid II flippase FtsW n=1 Tax=Bacilliculturomica massiliensis TaxID=1917867 RepID=UPI00102FCF1C|nr:putative lipid II flippase FtsW [Bacilliculturomica massiliensis]
MAKTKRLTSKLKTGDFLLTFIVMGLVVFGIIMVFSASYYVSISQKGTPYYWLRQDIMWAVLGTCAFIFCSLFDYKWYKKLAAPAMAVSVVLLILVLIPGISKSAKGAARWIPLGPVTIMPGEIAKVACIMFVAWYLSRRPDVIKSFKDGVLPMVGLLGLICGLIMMQPNLSTAITIAGIIVGIMFMAGLNWFYLGGVGAVGVAAVLAMIYVVPGGDYRLARMMSFRDPFADPLGTGWQVVQSLLALGSGGLFGVGLGKSIQKTLYLPEPQNDFIFAIIGEELGFIGCLILMAVYLVLIWRCCHIAFNAPDLFSMLLASGISVMVGVQVVLNIAVVTSSMPPTGIILPLVSYGGNALLLMMASMGVMINISRHSAN